MNELFNHAAIWDAIDLLAAELDMTPSAMAKKAGLDATAFNKSKRKTTQGKERLPGLDSIGRVLNATGTSADYFVSLIKFVL